MIRRWLEWAALVAALAAVTFIVSFARVQAEPRQMLEAIVYCRTPSDDLQACQLFRYPKPKNAFVYFCVADSPQDPTLECVVATNDGRLLWVDGEVGATGITT